MIVIQNSIERMIILAPQLVQKILFIAFITGGVLLEAAGDVQQKFTNGLRNS